MACGKAPEDHTEVQPAMRLYLHLFELFPWSPGSKSAYIHHGHHECLTPPKIGSIYFQGPYKFFGFSQIPFLWGKRTFSHCLSIFSAMKLSTWQGKDPQQQEGLEDMWTALHHHSACPCARVFVLCSYHPYILLPLLKALVWHTSTNLYIQGFLLVI